MTTRIIVILTGFLLSATGLSFAAVVIPVNNPSFENTTGVTFMSCGSPNCQFSDGLIPQWTISTGLAGLLQPALPPVVPAQFNFIPDGNNTAYNNGGTISQTLSSTVQNDLIYTFTVDLGLRLDFSTFHSSANIVLTLPAALLSWFRPWVLRRLTATGLNTLQRSSARLQMPVIRSPFNWSQPSSRAISIMFT